jgi:hypothetical protein
MMKNECCQWLKNDWNDWKMIEKWMIEMIEKWMLPWLFLGAHKVNVPLFPAVPADHTYMWKYIMLLVVLGLVYRSCKSIPL